MATETTPAEEAERTPEELVALVAQLTETERRIMGLVAMGWPDREISKTIFLLPYTKVTLRVSQINARLRLPSNYRRPMALFYVEHMLPTDLAGTPRDPSKPAYTEPGEKLEEWRVQAERIRAKLREAGALTPRVVEAAMLLADPNNAKKTKAELAELMSKPSVNPATYGKFVGRLTCFMRHGSMTKVAVVARLAPFTVNDELV